MLLQLLKLRDKAIKTQHSLLFLIYAAFVNVEGIVYKLYYWRKESYTSYGVGDSEGPSAVLFLCSCRPPRREWCPCHLFTCPQCLPPRASGLHLASCACH